jgi:hypothetical protein
MPAAILRILARNVESDGFTPIPADAFSPQKTHFPDFSIELIDKQSRLNYARTFFKDAMLGECIIEREYESIPPAPVSEDYGEFGGIPWDAEDLLLLLRLFRPGDLAFVSVSMQKPGGRLTKVYPYRVISDANHNSSRPFRIDSSDVTRWEVFATSMMSSPAWKSSWFHVARRWFLYGGAKEFNPNFEDAVDRVADYVAALEAALIPESDLFIQRRLRERAVRLLGINDQNAPTTKQILTRFYGIRSTLVHGSPLSDKELAHLRDRQRWLEFEQLVRDLLVAALRGIPAEDAARVSYLEKLYQPDDAERGEDFAKNFKTIKDPQVGRELLCKLLREF